MGVHGHEAQATPHPVPPAGLVVYGWHATIVADATDNTPVSRADRAAGAVVIITVASVALPGFRGIRGA
jgi:hypothetical protein